MDQHYPADSPGRSSPHGVMTGAGLDPAVSSNHMRPITAFLLMILSSVSFLRAEDSKPYPLTTCIVSGEKVGEMGPPVSIDYQGKKVAFCCDSCIAKFQKDPSKYLANQPAKP
jgi:YHS domain-containing protein